MIVCIGQFPVITLILGQFYHLIRENSPTGPSVIHCSDGLGRPRRDLEYLQEWMAIYPLGNPPILLSLAELLKGVK